MILRIYMRFYVISIPPWALKVAGSNPAAPTILSAQTSSHFPWKAMAFCFADFAQPSEKPAWS